MIKLEELNNSIVICDNLDKYKILDLLYEKKQIPTFKIMNLNEFIKKVTFNYDTRTIYYLINKYNLSYDTAITYIKNLYYIDDTNYKSEKLQYLVNLKKELVENQLLIIDTVFIDSIGNKKIIFYNINTDYKYIEKLLKDIKYEIKYDQNNNQYPKMIYYFENIENEINYVAQKICKLIENNIDINNIKLANFSNEYEFILPNIFKSYGLKIENNSKYLYGTIIGQKFLENLSEHIDETITMLRKEFNLDEETTENIDKIVDICNKYSWCDNFLEIKDMLEYELKNTKTYSYKYSNMIEIVDIENIDIDTNDYIFLLGFNQENIPKIYKDDDYITDKMKIELDIETSNEKNKRIRDILVNKILGLKNLEITYKKKTNFNEYYISCLNDYLNFEIKNLINLYNESYSKQNLQINLCKQLDDFVKFGVKDDTLSLLSSNFDSLPYKNYDNNYTKINKDDLIDYLDKKLLLSYSSIDNYYKCQFKFYINNILKLDPFEENFGSFIGSLMHHILQLCFNDNFDYEKEFNNYISNGNYNFTPKDKFFIKKIKKELKNIITIINNQKLLTNFNNELYEKQLFIPKNNDIKVTLMGIIDKIMFMEKNNKTYLAIIDYKTGYVNTDLKYVKHGLTLQLPIYADLIKNSDLFKNPVISGLYYQKLLNTEVESTTIENYEQEKQDSLKLIGLSTNDEEILKDFDSTYDNSELIAGMKLNKDGSFSKYSKIFTENELNDLINTTENKIDEAINGILTADFKINPKQIKKDNVSCKFCNYRDLCYMTENNKVLIEEGD